MDTQKLLDVLSVRFGFMLSGEDQARIVASPPADVDSFMAAVLRADGLDPVRYEDVNHSLRDCVSEHFGQPVWHGRKHRGPRR